MTELSADQSGNPSARFSLDHAYNLVDSSKIFQSLVERGFTASTREVEHEGRVLCRFFLFPGPESQRFQYLELCEIQDAQAQRAVRERDSQRSLSEQELTEPGLSLRSDEALLRIFETSRAQLAGYEPWFEHRSRRWQEDPSGPGWNYLQFRRGLVPGCNLWITEYEAHDPQAPRPSASEIPPHANTADRFLGALLHAPEPELRGLRQLLAAAEERDGALVLPGCGTLWIAGARDGPELLAGLAQKQTPLAAVVLRCSSLERFCEVARPDYVIPWRGQRAAGIRLGRNQWDILVTESAPR